MREVGVGSGLLTGAVDDLELLIVQHKALLASAEKLPRVRY